MFFSLCGSLFWTHTRRVLVLRSISNPVQVEVRKISQIHEPKTTSHMRFANLFFWIVQFRATSGSLARNTFKHIHLVRSIIREPGHPPLNLVLGIPWTKISKQASTTKQNKEVLLHVLLLIMELWWFIGSPGFVLRFACAYFFVSARCQVFA